MTNIGIYDWTSATIQKNVGILWSTTTGTTDSNALFSGYCISYFKIAMSGLENVNCRRMYYNTTNPTTLYFLFGGAYNYGYASNITYLQSTRIV